MTLDGAPLYWLRGGGEEGCEGGKGGCDFLRDAEEEGWGEGGGEWSASGDL